MKSAEGYEKVANSIKYSTTWVYESYSTVHETPCGPKTWGFITTATIESNLPLALQLQICICIYNSGRYYCESPVHSDIYPLTSLPPKKCVALTVNSFSNKSRFVRMASKVPSVPRRSWNMFAVNYKTKKFILLYTDNVISH